MQYFVYRPVKKIINVINNKQKQTKNSLITRLEGGIVAMPLKQISIYFLY